MAMRRSTARLARSQVLLAELEFPHHQVHIHRTRLPFIHLDSVLSFAKTDRDGQFDGFIAVYLPDELAVLLLAGGELTNAIAYREGGRTVLPIAPALDHIRAERERGELIYAAAPKQQLAWMYQSCAQPAAARFIDENQPDQLLQVLRHEVFSGVLEFIVDGGVNYLQFEVGEFVEGHFARPSHGEHVEEFVKRLLNPDPEGRLPRIAAAVFDHSTEIPEQASPQFVEMYRGVFWGLIDCADELSAGAARKQGLKYLDLVKNVHPSLAAVGNPPDNDPIAVVVTPRQLTSALCEWALQFLEQVEVIAPGAAVEALANATKENRFVLQKNGFYDSLPWKVSW